MLLVEGDEAEMDIARHWRLRGQRYTLTGSICTRCGKRFFAPRPVCDVCSAPMLEDEAYAVRRERRAEPVLAYEVAQR